MDPPNTPPMLEYILSEEILTKHKEAIRQLYKQAKFMLAYLAVLYNIGGLLINCVLRYNKLKQARPHRTNLTYKLNNTQINWIIEYFSKTYKQRVLN
jgi:hypothetical protein